MSHQSRNQRTLPPFDKITTHCRRAVFGIISALIAMTAAGMPATAQQFQLIGFAGAQAHGVLFEIIANPDNCPVQFGPDFTTASGGVGASFVVSVDCTQKPHLSRNGVTVRAFNKMLLNEPWFVAQAVVQGPPDLQIRHLPEFGTRHLMIEFDIVGLGGFIAPAFVFLKVSAPPTVTKPICPSIPRVLPQTNYSCSRDADCLANNFCQMPCGFCDTSPFTELSGARPVTLAEMRALGFGVEARTGDEHTAFRVIWEDVSLKST